MGTRISGPGQPKKSPIEVMQERVTLERSLVVKYREQGLGGLALEHETAMNNYLETLGRIAAQNAEASP